MGRAAKNNGSPSVSKMVLLNPRSVNFFLSQKRLESISSAFNASLGIATNSLNSPIAFATLDFIKMES